MNYCFFIGRLTKDVSEVKKTQNGHSMCHFTMAINNGRDKNGNELPPDFPQITLFGNLADVCARCLRKGSLVAVVGKYKTASKKNADGSMSYYNNIQADEVKFLEPTASRSPKSPARSSSIRCRSSKCRSSSISSRSSRSSSTSSRSSKCRSNSTSRCSQTAYRKDLRLRMKIFPLTRTYCRFGMKKGVIQK